MGLDLKGLDKFIKLLKDEKKRARVGVLGNKDSRDDSNSNATIGKKHEFGEEGVPIRSWLRMPIADHLQEFLEKSGIDEAVVKEAIRTGTFELLLKKLGIVSEEVIAEGFNTGGFGTWKPSNMDRKKVHQTLIETQQLRNSVTSVVVDAD